MKLNKATSTNIIIIINYKTTPIVQLVILLLNKKNRVGGVRRPTSVMQGELNIVVSTLTATVARSTATRLDGIGSTQTRKKDKASCLPLHLA